MAKEDLTKLNSDVLKKRKKFASFLIGLLIGLEIVFIAMLAYSFISEDPKNGSTSYYVFIPALIAVAIPVFIGIKKINEELAKRESSA